MGDFNSEMLEEAMGNFCAIYNFTNLVEQPRCYKSQENPSCIDLILTNRQNSFQDTRGIETGLPDYHKMTSTVLKTYFKKQHPKVISYRDYKNLPKLYSEMN